MGVEVLVAPVPLAPGSATAPVSGVNADNVDAVAPVGSAILRSDAEGYVFNGTGWDRVRAAGGAGDGLGVALATGPAGALRSNYPAVNTAAVITVNAVAGQRHRVLGLWASYNAAPTGGRLSATDGGVTVFDVDVSAAGPLLVPLPTGGLLIGVNTQLVITLAAAGAAVTGKLTATTITT